MKKYIGWTLTAMVLYIALFGVLGYVWFAMAMSCTNYVSIDYQLVDKPAWCAVADPSTPVANGLLVAALFGAPAVATAGVLYWLRRRRADSPIPDKPQKLW